MGLGRRVEDLDFVPLDDVTKSRSSTQPERKEKEESKRRGTSD